MRRVLFAAALALAASVCAAAPTARPKTPPSLQLREPTAEERSSFEEYYRLQVPARISGGPSLFAPVFDIQRRGKEP
jgi:hypothetical protein